jgi:hypothetical protein
MTTVLSQTAPINGGIVTPQGTPDGTVAVSAAVSLVANTVVFGGAASALNIFGPNPADANYDRIDLVTQDATGAIVMVTGTAQFGPVLAPSTSNSILSEVYILSQASPTYTGTITVDAITQTPQSEYILLPEPGQTFAYTFLNTALSLADPGAGNFGFDSTTVGSIAHLYVSYANAQVPGTGGSSAFSAGFRKWFQNNLLHSAVGVGPFYLRIWSRQDPSNWVLVEVTSYTDHSTYADIAVTPVSRTQDTVGSFTLTTDPLDCIFEFAGFVSGPVPESGTGVLGADVSIPSANTFVDGPTVSPAGGASASYLLTGYVTIAGPAGADTATVRLTDGTTVYAEGENSIGASSFGVVTLMAIVPGNATYKFTVAHTSATAATIKRDPTVNSSGAHVGSKLTFVRIA